MSTLKKTLVLIASVAVAAAVDGFEPGLRVTYGYGSEIGTSYLYNAPRTVSDAVKMDWVLTERPAGPLPELVMYCYPDKVVCCLFDDTGYIAGTQIAMEISEFSDNVFDWKRRGFTFWRTTVNGACKKFWALTQFYVDEEFLSRSKENRLACRDCSRILQAGAIWFTGTDGKLLRFANNEGDVARENLFTKQACFPRMGQHYFYNMTTELQCTADQIYPWFAMFKNGEISATAFLTIGKLEQQVAGTRNWVERVNETIIRAFIPYGSECVYALGTYPGAITAHFFYVDKPWKITCPASIV